jgi:hypothetical protein
MAMPQLRRPVNKMRGSFNQNPKSSPAARWIPSHDPLALIELRAQQRLEPLAMCLAIAPPSPLSAAHSRD